MQVILEPSFLKSAEQLPKNVKRKLARLVETAATNPFHPLLHTKHLKGDLMGFLSFRITRDWRVVFYFKEPDTIHLLEVGHRKDMY